MQLCRQKRTGNLSLKNISNRALIGMQSEIDNILKGKICTLNCPLDELAIFHLIMENPNVTWKEIANKIGKSERTVKNKVTSLKEKGVYSEVKWETKRQMGSTGRY